MRRIELNWDDMQGIAMIASTAAELLDLETVLEIAVELRNATQAIIAGQV
jgi:hypothetical protein